LKGRVTEPEEMAIARQWHGKHVSMATYTPTTIEEPWEAVFSVQSMLRLYNDQWDQLVVSQHSQLVVGHEHGSRGISNIRSCYQAVSSVKTEQTEKT
jgi:hypothetical protein